MSRYGCEFGRSSVFWGGRVCGVCVFFVMVSFVCGQMCVWLRYVSFVCVCFCMSVLRVFMCVYLCSVCDCALRGSCL